jgi:hypothetical protein
LSHDSDWGRFVVHEEERKICGQVSDIGIFPLGGYGYWILFERGDERSDENRPLQMTRY